MTSQLMSSLNIVTKIPNIYNKYDTIQNRHTVLTNPKDINDSTNKTDNDYTKAKTSSQNKIIP